MISEENEKIIKDLLSHDIKYPLTVIGYDCCEYKIYNLYIHQNRIMMKVSDSGFMFTDKISNFSLEFQKNLINKLLKLTNDKSIWND